MANVSDRDSCSLHIVLERVDPSRNIARYYVLSIEPTLFATHTIIRRWGRIGSFGQERLKFFGGDNTSQAQVTLETWLAQKRKLGYAPRSEPARPALLFRKRVSGQRFSNERRIEKTLCAPTGGRAVLTALLFAQRVSSSGLR